MSERSVFLEALEIAEPAERAAFLEKACGEDAELRRRVDELLAANERTGQFLEGPAVGETLTADEGAEGPGSWIGPYRLLEKIGEGGMGSVYMARQESPVARTVALKVIRPGMDPGSSVLARFEAERQALAMMDHPNIARVLDAGATESGSPYFVMELVKGVPITRFCLEHGLGLRERLELFIPVCQAIQHAHQKGIIHRDIKPSNVLVAMYDDRPVPKVIDFGVAKATGPKLTDRTLFTAFGAVVGTLEYMSPEQARLNQLDIDTRSDVYALGVLLYELLTGTTPIQRSRLRSAAFDEILRLIREEEPERPSTRLSTSHAKPAEMKGMADAVGLGRALRGELDWVVMKALEKDRSRRYETANGLARDVQRFLADEPVEACPPTLGYRLGKAYRRHRATVTAASAFLVLLAGSALLATALAIQARRAERQAAEAARQALRNEAEAVEQRQRAEEQRQRAEEEQKAAQAVRDFLQVDLLGQADEFQQAETRRLGGEDFAVTADPTVGELLDRASARLAPGKIEARFPGLPYVQAEALRTVGDAYLVIGHHQQGADHLRRAVDLYNASRGPDDPATLKARRLLAEALRILGRHDEAETMIRAVIAGQSRVIGAGDPETIYSRIALGYVLQSLGRPAEAIDLYRDVNEVARTHLGPEHLYTLWSATNLVGALASSGRADEAVPIIEDILAHARRITIAFDHPATSAGVLTFAEVYRRAGRPDDADRLVHEFLATAETAGGPLHPSTWSYRNDLAWTHLGAGRPEQALPFFEANARIEFQDLRLGLADEGVALCHLEAGRFAEAESRFRRAFELMTTGRGASFDALAWRRGRVRTRIGRALLRQGKADEAEPWLVDGYQQLIAFTGLRPPWDDDVIPRAQEDLRELGKALGRDVLAAASAGVLSDLERDWQQLREAEGSLTPRVVRETARLVKVAIDAGRPEDAVRLHETILADVRSAPPADPALLRELEMFRYALKVPAVNAHGAEMCVAIVDGLRSRPGVPPDVLAAEVFHLGHHLLFAHRFDQAEPLLRESLEYQMANDPGGWQTTKNRFWLGIALLGQSKFGEAEPLLLRSFEEITSSPGRIPSWEKNLPGYAADRLAVLYSKLGRAEEVDRWQAERAKWAELK